MEQVHLRPVSGANLNECLRLRVGDDQTHLVAFNATSLAEASVNPSLTSLAIYDRAALGHEVPPVPMVGFTMYEVTAGVGFILRLMIDARSQRRGYGRAAMVEVIRRLRLHPDVEVIATSHLRENEAAGRLYRGLGFVPWEIEWAQGHPTEAYLVLPSGLDRTT